MAWPCVTRACCIARFGNKQDKGDIAVPLMFSKYSEVTDGTQSLPRPGSAAIETQPCYGGQSRSSKELSSRGSVMRQDYKPWKSTPEPSCKPRSEYQPSEAPLERETQYKKDYRSWPIPRQGDHPWIPKPIPHSPSMHIHPTVLENKKTDVMGSILPPLEKRISDLDPRESLEHRLMKGRVAIAYNVTPEILVSVVQESKVIQHRELMAKPPPKETSQGEEDGRGGSSYRNEFRAWTDVKPVKSIKAKYQYKPPEERVAPESSYTAMFKGECNQPVAGDNKLTERRRIRSLYSEPQKESTKVEKPSVQTSKPKKITPSHKPVKKAKDKQLTPGRASKKKAAETATSTAKPDDKEKSKEINNKLAEAKE
ncbi:PREDICTED: microtubule-associated protein 6 isoform X2 [Nanorana parkeri]|uniref:microtubule-associated protein 6 isoform X2 n=1 Tax=Nanorana parkeri TaxID=125878 RepID=UPI000854172B|nr:PREDICTED: microtubule-associated protein 6 isoform X2 [Nanorana parkeri]